MMSKFFSRAAVVGAVALPVGLVACGSDNPISGAQDAVCCTEFKVGATVDAKIGGSVQSQVAVQAVADFSGIASAAIEDITGACRSMATDLGAAKTDTDTAEANADPKARMNAYCSLAVAQIKAKITGSVKIDIVPAQCEASFSAKANCSAKCSATGKCDADPGKLPTCEGGKLNVDCSGSCKADVNTEFHCEGKCDVVASGSCTATGGVDCQGKCQGTCKGAAQGGKGDGIKADGTCSGTCEGTCEATAPGAKCEGTFNGSCKGSCAPPSANVTVKCDAKCDATVTPLSCSGGKPPHIDCQVDAKCDANCDASVSAKAKCTPPSVTVEIAGATDLAAAGKLKATLEANFGVIAALRGKVDGMIKASGDFTGNVKAVTDIKAGCIIPVASAVVDGVDNAQAALSASGSIVTAVGGT